MFDSTEHGHADFSRLYVLSKIWRVSMKRRDIRPHPQGKQLFTGLVVDWLLEQSRPSGDEYRTDEVEVND